MRSLVLVLLAAAFAAGVAACGGGGSADQTVATPTTTDADPSAPDREPAPAISGASLEGESIALADFAGRPVLVNVWSSW